MNNAVRYTEVLEQQVQVLQGHCRQFQDKVMQLEAGHAGALHQCAILQQQLDHANAPQAGHHAHGTALPAPPQSASLLHLMTAYSVACHATFGRCGLHPGSHVQPIHGKTDLSSLIQEHVLCMLLHRSLV